VQQPTTNALQLEADGQLADLQVDVVVGQPEDPSTIDPGEPSRPTPGPPALVASVAVPPVVAAPAPACSPKGGSTADGTH
jgi:hypothetical protein